MKKQKDSLNKRIKKDYQKYKKLSNLIEIKEIYTSNSNSTI